MRETKTGRRGREENQQCGMENREGMISFVFDCTTVNIFFYKFRIFEILMTTIVKQTPQNYLLSNRDMKKVSNRHEMDKQMDMRGIPQQSTHKGVKLQRVRWESDNSFFFSLKILYQCFQYVYLAKG